MPVPAVAPPCTERIEFRLPVDAKNMIEQAANLQGRTVADFAREALCDRAQEICRQFSQITLSNRDRDTFLALLDAPVELNDSLRAAAARYGQKVRSGDLDGTAYRSAPAGSPDP